MLPMSIHIVCNSIHARRQDFSFFFSFFFGRGGGGGYIHVPQESGPNNKAMQVSKTESFLGVWGHASPEKV